MLPKKYDEEYYEEITLKHILWIVISLCVMAFVIFDFAKMFFISYDLANNYTKSITKQVVVENCIIENFSCYVEFSDNETRVKMKVPANQFQELSPNDLISVDKIFTYGQKNNELRYISYALSEAKNE